MDKLNLDNLFRQEDLKKLFGDLRQAELIEDKNHYTDRIEEVIELYIRSYHDLKYALNKATTITITDKDGIITYVDDHFCALSQYSKEQLIGRTHRVIKSGFHDRSFFRKMWDNISSGKVWHGEVKNVTKGGSFFWVKTTIVPLLDVNNNPYAFMAFRTDITEGKKTEEKLYDALQNDFRRTVNALVNLVFKVKVNNEGDYCYTMYEGKLARDIGLVTEAVEGKKIETIFGAEKAAFLRMMYARAFKGESLSYKHKYKDRYFYTTLSPNKENGKVMEVIGSSIDVTIHEEAELRVRHMAYHDPLTDLPNRRKLHEDLQKLIKRADLNEGSFSILFCDLDRFKYVNDALGHTAGDQVILTMADRIQEAIGYKGELYRLGGDEFIIILEHNEKSHTKVKDFAYEVLHHVDKPMKIMGRELFLTGSIGISHYPNDGMSAEQLIQHADIAMHYCKMNGSQSVLAYTPEMNQSYNELIKLEGQLRLALKNEELSLYYQPKVDLLSGELVGMEALVRWNHPEDGFISPGKFIPIAEETGLITQVGEWVLKAACLQNKKWIDQGYLPQRVAVNISAIELQRNDFVFKLNQILESTQLSPEYLEIEITENSIMQNTASCIKTMKEIRALGITLSIDDFGTGYSSLGYLRRFPIHNLKIDQSFIRDVLKDPSDAEIVKAMIQLAHTYKLNVIAEGVEDDNILAFLKEHKCDYYQGYYFSRPLPVEEFKKYLHKKS